MFPLPKEFVIFDTEYTSWEGSKERGWSGDNEYREVIQIGAVKVEDLEETDAFLVYVRPEKNPVLSDYIMNLTGITQMDIDQHGLPFAEAQGKFFSWCSGLPVCSFGSDPVVMQENSQLVGAKFPFSSDIFFDIRKTFRSCGVDTSRYMSSTIPLAFGVTPPPDAHDAQNDARSILVALQAANQLALENQ